jgi:heptosyltransferase-3
MNDRLLVIRPGAIGDALLACPALAALRAANPGTTVMFLAHPSVRQLVLLEGLADRFFSRDGSEADALFAPSPALARERVGAIRAAVAWSADPGARLATNLATLGAEPLLIAPSRPPETSGKHAAQFLIDTLAPFGLRASAQDWRGFRLAWCPGGAPRKPTSSTRPLVVLHLGSGSPSKNWPAERFVAVGATLWKECHARLHVAAGPADGPALQAFAQAAEFPYETLLGRPLEELALLLSSCDLYVGNDSGVSHLAGMCGAPTVALFGPTDPRLWRPLGPRVTVLRAEPLDCLDEDDVATVAFELLSEPATAAAEADYVRPAP